MSKTPQESTKLFQAGPGANACNVVLNLGHEPDTMLGLYAVRFHRAGKILADNLMSAPGYNDLDACPIVYLYRHSLELYLKAIVRIGRRYSAYTRVKVQVNADKLNSSHSLSVFFNPVRQTFQAAGWKWELDQEGIRTFKEVETLLEEFDAVDGGSFAFRYPIDKIENDNVSREFRMSVVWFCHQMDVLLDHLEAAVMGLEVELSQRDEFQQ